MGRRGFAIQWNPLKCRVKNRVLLSEGNPPARSVGSPRHLSGPRTPPPCATQRQGVPGTPHTSSLLLGNPSLTDISSGEPWHGPWAQGGRETPTLRSRLTGLWGTGTSSCFHPAGEEGVGAVWAWGGCMWGCSASHSKKKATHSNHLKSQMRSSADMSVGSHREGLCCPPAHLPQVSVWNRLQEREVLMLHAAYWPWVFVGPTGYLYRHFYQSCL